MAVILVNELVETQGCVVLAYDTADDVFQLYPEKRPLDNDELQKLLDMLKVKYDEYIDIIEAPDSLEVIKFYDGYGI